MSFQALQEALARYRPRSEALRVAPVSSRLTTLPLFVSPCGWLPRCRKRPRKSKRDRLEEGMTCKACGNTEAKTYCNTICQQKDKRSKLIHAWLDGSLPGWKGERRQTKKFVISYLHETRGTCCERCGWDERHPVDGAVLTEVDHIDGDAENCVPSNLRVLCPNCHSMTPTFRRRNTDSKRKR